MSIIDHLIRCVTQEEADAFVQTFGPSRAYQPRVILQDAVWGDSDPEAPVLVSPEITAAGYHVWIALDVLDEALRDLPDNNCRLIADRNAALAGAPFIDFMKFVATDVDQQILDTARIEPIPFGSGYPFRAV